MNSIKNWSYRRTLQTKKSQSLIKSSLANAGKFGKGQIGIIYDATSSEDVNYIKGLKNKYFNSFAKVHSLGYYPEKLDVSSLAYKAFSPKEIKWNGVPSSPLIEEFINRQMDLLICPVSDPSPAMRYIITMANAQFKVGIQTGYEDLNYDIALDIGTSFPGISTVFQEFINYLVIAGKTELIHPNRVS